MQIFNASSCGDVKINENHCARLLFARSRCDDCMRSCPQDAISFSTREYKVARDCNGCGICYSACRTGAIKLSDNLDEVVLNKILKEAKRKKVRFLCSKAKADEDSYNVVLSCISRLTENVLFRLIKTGFEVEIVKGECSGCEYEKSLFVFERNMNFLEDILSSFNIKERPVIKQEIAEKEIEKEESPRREFFRMFAKPIRDMRAEKPRRLFFMDLIQGPLSERETDFLLNISINDNCNLCGACVFVCPTKAITVEKDDIKGIIYFSPSLCVGCRNCIDVCMKEAVKGERGNMVLLNRDTVKLKELNRQVCTHCGTVFYSAGEKELCDICKMRKEKEDALFASWEEQRRKNDR
ncbi:MAG: hypothetical protein B5M53_04545 [Candidatus Cloacimonas sp. 4484_209]|nr:MAG: hypothetical protein B5M53_04545 [Candidatus Cloacimonas sp. 4484_209]